MATPLAEMRLAVISLVHRHDKSTEELICRADKLMEWITRDNGADKARPKKGDPQEVKPSEP